MCLSDKTLESRFTFAACRMSLLDKMSKEANSILFFCRMDTALELKPHCRLCGVPFIRRTTAWLLTISCTVVTPLLLSGWAPERAADQASLLFRTWRLESPSFRASYPLNDCSRHCKAKANAKYFESLKISRQSMHNSANGLTACCPYGWGSSM